MSLLFGCGLCCMLLSVWAILQLHNIFHHQSQHQLGKLFATDMRRTVAIETVLTLREIAMGFFFKMEVVAFIEEAEPDHHSYDDFDDFMKQTKDNYQKIGVNCWVAAVLYVLTLGLSYMCIKKSQSSARLAAEKIKDDELFCREKAKNL